MWMEWRGRGLRLGGPVQSAQSGIKRECVLDAALRHNCNCYQLQVDFLAGSDCALQCHHRLDWFLI